MPPLAAVALQEGDALNTLLTTVRASAVDLARGLAGELARSDAMDGLARCLVGNTVPPGWAAVGGATLKPLDVWVSALAGRAAQLAEWLTDPSGTPPRILHVPHLAAPRALLTALAQGAARRAGWSLDATAVVVEPAKKGATDAPPPRDALFLGGLLLEGGRWDERAGVLDAPHGPRDLTAPLPPLLARAVPADSLAAATAGC